MMRERPIPLGMMDSTTVNDVNSYCTSAGELSNEVKNKANANATRATERVLMDFIMNGFWICPAS